MTDQVTSNALDFNKLLTESEGYDDADSEKVPTPYELNNFRCLYWEPSDLPSVINTNQKNLLLHFNIQSLSAKFDNLIRFLNVASQQSRLKKPYCHSVIWNMA